MKLRDSRLALPADGHWLGARLRHSPDVDALALVLRCPGTADPAGLPALVDALHAHGFATVVLDLLTETEEARHPDTAYNVPLLALRVLAAAEWAAHQPDLIALPLFVAAGSTACGAAIRAAWKSPGRFGAIACLGGRPDLAGATPLAAITTPTRLIVTEDDPDHAIVLRASEALASMHDLRCCDGSDAAARATTLALEWLAHWREALLKDPGPSEDAAS